MQGTNEFSKAMGISQRTAEAWAQAGLIKAKKVKGSWSIEPGEADRVDRLRWEQFLVSCGCDPRVAEIMVILVKLDPERREVAKKAIIKIGNALEAGMDGGRFSELVRGKTVYDMDLDAVIAECMPSTH
jgi:hypothetical protein